MKTISAPLFLVAILAASPVAAAATGWNDIAPGARLRAISAGTEIDGKALIGLELTLQPGQKTYWRVPGETGVPTELSVSDADGARKVRIRWPLPERDVSQGFVDFVYRDTLVLPALVDMPADKAATLDVHMGICSDVCVPVHASFMLPGDTKADAGNALRLKQALADTPEPWQGENAPLSDIRFDRQAGVLTLRYDPARIDPAHVFPSLDGGTEIFSAPKSDAGTGTLRFTLFARKTDKSWTGEPLRLTFATVDGPYDIVQSAETR